MFDISEKPKLVEKAFLIGVFHTQVEKEQSASLLDELAALVETLAIPVATNVIGFPAIPLPAAVAVRAFDPAPAPSVQLPAVATPFAPVVGVAPVTPPPPAVTPNVTPTPATGLPD